MKRLISLIFLLAISSSGAQQIDTRRHIEVGGTAKIFAEVDRATWRITLRGEAQKLEDASKALDTSTSALQDRLKKAGFADDVLRVSGIASGRNYEKGKMGRVFKGYYAERASVLEISDLSKRRDLETALLFDDSIEIVAVNFQSSKHEALRKQALLSAVAAATEKAKFLANEAGAEIGLLLAISEGKNQWGWANVTENRIGNPIFGQKSSPEFEKLEYSATVTVKFELK